MFKLHAETVVVLLEQGLLELIKKDSRLCFDFDMITLLKRQGYKFDAAALLARAEQIAETGYEHEMVFRWEEVVALLCFNILKFKDFSDQLKSYVREYH